MGFIKYRTTGLITLVLLGFVLNLAYRLKQALTAIFKSDPTPAPTIVRPVIEPLQTQ